VARGVSTLVSVVVFALLASSAAAVTSEGTTRVPDKRGLQVAASSFANEGPASLGRRVETAKTPARTRTSRRSGVVLGTLESGLLARVNAVRRSHGLRPLKISRGLSAAAAHHSRQMVQHGFFEHESRGGGSFWKRVERFYGSGGFRAWEVGENLAYGSPDLGAAATVRMWMNSPGHRDNVLSRRWREIGLGALHAASAGGEFGGGAVTVVTADFGIRVR
jgi:uncharacterized protein YkwD